MLLLLCLLSDEEQSFDKLLLVALFVFVRCFRSVGKGPSHNSEDWRVVRY